MLNYNKDIYIMVTCMLAMTLYVDVINLIYVKSNVTYKKICSFICDRMVI